MTMNIEKFCLRYCLDARSFEEKNARSMALAYERLLKGKTGQATRLFAYNHALNQNRKAAEAKPTGNPSAPKPSPTKPVPKPATKKPAPGTDFRCRCVALPYVPEFEDDYEATREKGEQRGVLQGKNSSAATMELLKKSLAEQAVKRLNRSLNKALKRAKGFARERGEKNAEFTEVEPYIWSDARQAKKDKSSDERVQKEMEMARIAVRNGYAVVRLYENSGSKRKNPDCCMDDLVTEMKRCKFAKLEARLRDALEQAPNAFIQLEEDKSHTEIVEALKIAKKNIEKEPEQIARNKERFRRIRSNLYSAYVFIASGKKFFRGKLSRLK